MHHEPEYADELTTETGEAIDTGDTTVGLLYDSIETNLWLTDAYARGGEEGLALECLRAAWLEYVRFQDVLRVYAGRDLGERILAALVGQTGDRAAAMALGINGELLLPFAVAGA